MPRQRVLSGMRPTGRLHLGHYYGVISNWLKLADGYECLFFAADWHALTTEYAAPSSIPENTRQMVIDWISSGVDPEASTIFRQSAIKEHAELFVLLSMIVPLPWLERNPTYKEQLEELKDKDIRTFGFLGYPVLQTADIIVYKAEKVPVGIDQAPHLELSREIARRFNHLYSEVFPEPQTMLTKVPKILGTDGRKMSKSYNNAVFLSDEPKVVEEKLLHMITDTARKKRSDAGSPDLCPFFLTYHALLSDEEALSRVREGCTKALIGCIECKKSVIPKVLTLLEPMQKKRKELEKNPGMVDAVLERGNIAASRIASSTMRQARAAMGIE